MKRATILIVGLAVAVPVLARQGQAPAPQIQNGRVEARSGAAIDREIAAVSSPSSTNPVWVAWRAAMIPGDRDLCSWYSDRLGTVRGTFLDDELQSSNIDVRTSSLAKSPTGPIPLEAGTNLVVLARVIGGRVERLRTAGDDCPMDAGGRIVYWLSDVTSAESLRFLTSLIRPIATDRSMFSSERQIAQTAVRAIGYHNDAAADAALDQIASDHSDADVRRQAASTLGSLRGAHGAATLTRLLTTEKDAADRRRLVTALGQSREAAAVETLRSLTRDADASLRSEAVYWFVVRGGKAAIPEALKIIAADAADTVRRRAVTAISRLPGDAGVTDLIQLVRTSPNDAVRKEAVNALSQSKDPRAMALMEEILKK